LCFGGFVIPGLIIDVWPWLLTLNIILILFFIHRNFEILKRKFNNISKTVWIALFIILLFAVAIRITGSPWMHHDYFAEWDYMTASGEMVQNGKFAECNYGNFELCNQYNPIPYKIGFPFITATAYFLFHQAAVVTKSTNLFFSVFNVLLIFMLAYLFFKREDAALWSAAFYAIFPLEILFSTTGTPDIISVTVSMFAFITLIIFVEQSNYDMLALAVFVFVLLVQMRNEAHIFLLLAVLYVLIFNRSLLRLVWSYKFWIIILAASVFEAITLYHTATVAMQMQWMKMPLVISMQKLLFNNYYFDVWNRYATLFASILFILSVIVMVVKYRRHLLFISLWLASILIIFTVNPFTSERFFLQLMLCIALIIGIGICEIMGLIISYSKGTIMKKLLPAINIVLIILFMTSFYGVIGKANIKPDYVLQFEEEQQFVDDFRKMGVKNDDFVATAIPYFVYYETGLNAINAQMKEEIEQLLMENRTVYFFKNVFCFQDFEMYCSGITDYLELELLSGKEQKYELYKIKSVMNSSS